MTSLDRSPNWRWYAASFARPVVPAGELFYMFFHSGGLPPRMLWWTWGGSGVAGISCSLIGSGGLRKKATDTWGNLALALHTSSLVFLMLIQLLRASAGAG